MKCKITKNKDESLKVTFNLSKGELLALYHGLVSYAEKSVVGSDVAMYLKNAIVNSSITDIE